MLDLHAQLLHFALLLALYSAEGVISENAIGL